MPQADLEKVLNLFDPRRPLQMDELDAYYVARPHAPLEPMKTYLPAVHAAAREGLVQRASWQRQVH